MSPRPGQPAPVTLLDIRSREVISVRIPSKGFEDRGIGDFYAPINAPVSMTYNVILKDLGKIPRKSKFFLFYFFYFLFFIFSIFLS